MFWRNTFSITGETHEKLTSIFFLLTQIVHSRSLTHGMNAILHMSVRLLTIKISQWERQSSAIVKKLLETVIFLDSIKTREHNHNLLYKNALDCSLLPVSWKSIWANYLILKFGTKCGGNKKAAHEEIKNECVSCSHLELRIGNRVFTGTISDSFLTNQSARSMSVIRDFVIHYGGLLLRPWRTRLTTPFPPQTSNRLRFRCTATGCSASTCLYKNWYVFYFQTTKAWSMTMISFSCVDLASP